MAVPGGPSKYTRERHEVIVDAVRNGNSKANAFRLAGLHPDSPFRWLQLGREKPDEYPEFAQLVEDIDTAIAICEAERVAVVKREADTGDWHAAAWWLERRSHEDWGKKDRVTVDPGDRPLVQLNQVVLEDGHARELTRGLLRQLAASSADVTLGPGSVRELAEDDEG